LPIGPYINKSSSSFTCDDQNKITYWYINIFIYSTEYAFSQNYIATNVLKNAQSQITKGGFSIPPNVVPRVIDDFISTCNVTFNFSILLSSLASRYH
jgi:hypothetical protein